MNLKEHIEKSRVSEGKGENRHIRIKQVYLPVVAPEEMLFKKQPCGTTLSQCFYAKKSCKRRI